MAGNHDFYIDQGATFKRTITLRRNGVPVNLTGYSGRMQLRSFVTQEDPDLDLTTEDGGLSFTDLEAGKVLIHITATQSAALAGKYVYNLEILANGDVDRPLEGSVIMSPDANR